MYAHNKLRLKLPEHILMPRERIVDRGIRVPSETIRKMVETGFRFRTVRLYGLRDGEDNRTGSGSGPGIAEEPVLPACRDRADGVLRPVVADLNLTMVGERAKKLTPIAFFCFPAADFDR